MVKVEKIKRTKNRSIELTTEFREHKNSLAEHNDDETEDEEDEASIKSENWV